MADAQISNANSEVGSWSEPVYPRLQRLPLASASLLVGIALSTALFAFQYASVCSVRFGLYEGIAVAVGVLITGAVFNWIAWDVLLAEFMPMGWDLSATMSILVWVVLMAGTIQVASIVLGVNRISVAFVARLAVASVLVGVYAASSTLGFCVISRTWLA